MRKKLEQIRLAIFKMILAKRHLLYVNGSEALPPPLSKSEENLLIKRLAGGESEVVRGPRAPLLASTSA